VQEEIPHRFENVLDIIDEIKTQCKVASISIGVLHEGKAIFRRSFGYRDVENKLPADSDSMYMLASLSKNFLVASVGILVHEGKLKWEDPVSAYVPDFNPKDDPQIREKANFIDILRHSGGLSNPVVSVLGPDGKVLLPPEDFIHLVNTAPTGNDVGQYYDRTWEYSNVGYGVVALAVESTSGMSYSEFVQKKILEPLRLRRTAVTESQVATDDNIAYPYVQLQDGRWEKLQYEWTSEQHTPVLAAFGKRSCVNDLLIWCAATMSAEFEEDEEMKPGILQDIQRNPLKQMKRIRTGYWTRPHDDPFQNQSEYCMGWMRAVMPSSQVGWGSYNTLTTYDAERTSHKYILGTESPKRPFLKHTGLGIGTAICVHTFPDTRSAVVVLSNGLNLGDASDFTAQILIQELFDLRPRIDLMPWVKLETERRLAEFHNTIMLGWLENRNVSEAERPQEEFIGDYYGLAITLSVTRNEKTKKLQLQFNKRDDCVVQLEYYNVDKYSYMPTTRDKWLAGGWLDWDYYMIGVLDFTREKDEVNGLWWKWEEPSNPSWFVKKKLPRPKWPLPFLIQ